MKKQILLSCLLAFGLTSCSLQSVNSQNNAQYLKEVVISPPLEAEKTPEFSDFYVKSDSLIYSGHEVRKLSKKIDVEVRDGLAEVEYAVLVKNGKKLAEFEPLVHPLNITDFGLFSFFGDETKQLIVSNTVPRGGRHWIVNLSPKFEILFDSFDYGVGREEVSIIDVNKDGLHEISLSLTEFYSFENLAPANTPLPEIIFKYDQSERKFLPANHLFQEYALRDVKDRTSRIGDKEKDLQFADVLDVTLIYIYAGQESTAWAFFDNKYNFPDKEELKSKIKQVLKDEPVYKFISRQKAKN